MHLEDHGSLPPGRGLALECGALRRLECTLMQRTALRAELPGRTSAPRDGTAAPPDAGDSTAPADDGERLLIWESAEPAVVLPRNGEPALWACRPACAARGVPLLRRGSGGGAVVVGPGCLNFALVLSLDRRPWLTDVERSYEWLLGRLAAVLAVDGIAVRSSDLAIRDRKFAGHAQRRVHRALLHHGVALYDFDLELIEALLPEPRRRPGWRGDRTHREFLANAPLSRDEIVRRLGRLPTLLDHSRTASRNECSDAGWPST